MTKTTKSEPTSYKSHKVGSRKGDVHREFDKRGRDAAEALGLRLKLKIGTLRSWFGTWDRSKPAKKVAAPKPKAKKEAAKSKRPLSRSPIRVKATARPNSNVATLRAA